MQLAEAARLVSRLKAAFPRMTLDEEEMELVIREVSLLADPLILNSAVDRIIRTSERFPTIAEIRAQYHAVAHAKQIATPALERGGPREGIPEWVQVWRWQSARTMTERQAAREGTRLAVADRPPMPMRDFPQFDHPGPDAYTVPEYEAIRDEWVAAGSPTLGSVEEIIGTAISAEV